MGSTGISTRSHMKQSWLRNQDHFSTRPLLQCLTALIQPQRPQLFDCLLDTQSFFSAFSAVLCFLGLDGAAFLGLEAAALVGLSGLISLDAAVGAPFFGLEGFAVLVSTASLKDVVPATPLSVLAGAVLSVFGFLASFLGDPEPFVSVLECFPVSAVVSSPSAAGTTCPGVSSAPFPGVAEGARSVSYSDVVSQKGLVGQTPNVLKSRKECGNAFTKQMKVSAGDDRTIPCRRTEGSMRSR